MQWAFIFRASISIIGTDRYPIECLSLLYCVCRTIKQCWYLGFAICAEQRPFEDDFVLFSLSSVCIILGRQCDIVNEVPPLIHCAAYLWSTKQFPTPAQRQFSPHHSAMQRPVALLPPSNAGANYDTHPFLILICQFCLYVAIFVYFLFIRPLWWQWCLSL